MAVIISFLVFQGSALASWNSENIIPDSQFIAAGTMSEQKIQDFLASKNSYLANYTETRDSLVGPNNDVPTRGWKASRIIWQTANWYGLNPQVILATLQKEQSLITNPSLNQYGIDWAMGYGVPDSGNRDYSKQGFSMQVDWATWQLRWNMDKANSIDPVQRAKVSPYYTGNTILIDGVYTYLSNGATASLYRYTPHFHGNQNFYNIYALWFNFGSYIQDTVKVSASLILSRTSPAVGEEVSATFSISNNSGISITLPMLGVASWYQYPDFNPRDFGFESVTLDPNETKALTFKRVFTEIGSYKAWVAFYYDGVWYQVNGLDSIITNSIFDTHKPNISVNNVVSLSTPYPVTNQEINAQLSIKNNEPSPVRLDAVGIANWTNYPAFSPADYGFLTNRVLAATGDNGDTLNLSFSKSFSVVSDKYRAWGSYLIGDKWYEISGSGTGYSLVAIDALKISSSLSLSRTNPAIGEEVTATFSVTNYSVAPIVLPMIGVANWYSYPAFYPRDFGFSSATLGAGETKQFSFKKTFWEIGQYKAWVSFLYGDKWYSPLPDSGKSSEILFSTHAPNISALLPTDINPDNPLAGQNATASITIKNNEPSPVRLDAVGIANWTNYPAFSPADYGFLTNRVLAATGDNGDTLNLSFSKSFSVVSDKYRAWGSYLIGDKWYEISGSGTGYRIR